MKRYFNISKVKTQIKIESAKNHESEIDTKKEKQAIFGGCDTTGSCQLRFFVVGGTSSIQILLY